MTGEYLSEPAAMEDHNMTHLNTVNFSRFGTLGVNEPGLSTPRYAQSKGRAKAAVKALVSKASVNGDITSDEFQKGLLEWRNTPKEHGKSPAELVFGCQQRSRVQSLR